MNIEDIKAMSDFELRGKIAQIRGLRGLFRGTRKGNPSPDGVEWWYVERDKGGWKEYDTVPNYPADLNAVAVLEASLTSEQRVRYAKELHFSGVTSGPLCLEPDPDLGVSHDYEQVFRIIHATARQRCEAFVLTMGL